jgi:flagellar basal-body rod protein FlgG
MATKSLRTAATGMYAQQLNIQVISNNIANINTTGFKKNKAEFQDLMYQNIPTSTLAQNNITSPQNSNQALQVGSGVKASSTQKIFKQGDLQQTNNSLDLAIQGDGFFQVRKADGTYAYTRDGSFKVSGDGRIVTASGYILEPEISLTDDILQINISRDGAMEVKTSGGNSYVLDNIQLVRFINPGGLEALGDNLYAETESSGQPILGTPGMDGFGEIQQGFLEASNVDIVEEMIAMITAQRAYEINSKTVKTVEEMMTMTNNLKR